MIAFINALTGTEMLVAEDRMEEYKAAGHKLAADTSVKAKKAETVQESPKKAPMKKQTTARKR